MNYVLSYSKLVEDQESRDCFEYYMDQEQEFRNLFELKRILSAHIKSNANRKFEIWRYDEERSAYTFEDKLPYINHCITKIVQVPCDDEYLIKELTTLQKLSNEECERLKERKRKYDLETQEQELEIVRQEKAELERLKKKYE